MKSVLYEKTTCHFQIKFIPQDYLQMYLTLQLLANTFTFIANNITSIIVIKSTKLLTMPSSLQLGLN